MDPSATRAFRFTFDVGVAPARSPTRIWVPRPIDDAWQRCVGEALPADLAREAGTDDATGNRMICLTVPASDTATQLEVSYDIERRRTAVPRPDADDEYREPPTSVPALARYLRADRKVPIDGPVVADAARLGDRGDPPLRLARRVYDHLIATLEYDSAGCTPERVAELGDLAAACDIRRGTCTEFHGLFVAHMRALGVPARFVFGFNVPRKPAGRIAGYHCWALIASPEDGWFPIDVSEGFKQPDRRDFYFGALDADRVAFTFDRDVALAPPGSGEPLDKVIFPYAETAGAEAALELGFRFADR
jgi:transglutaminase-like putative cysteine protease